MVIDFFVAINVVMATKRLQMIEYTTEHCQSNYEEVQMIWKS